MPEFTDKVLKCIDCGCDFLFTAGERSFFAQKNLKNEPKRCKTCNANRKQGASGARSKRTDVTVTCTQCGRQAKVPFQPAQGRPVYCYDCFQQRRAAAVGSRC